MNYGHIVANRRYRTLGLCERCGTEQATDRHHRNQDTYDNNRGNIEFLCRRCHVATHHPSPPTHCRNGHEYTPENSVINTQGNRICRTCKNERARAARSHA